MPRLRKRPLQSPGHARSLVTACWASRSKERRITNLLSHSSLPNNSTFYLHVSFDSGCKWTVSPMTSVMCQGRISLQLILCLEHPFPPLQMTKTWKSRLNSLWKPTSITSQLAKSDWRPTVEHSTQTQYALLSWSTAAVVGQLNSHYLRSTSNIGQPEES